MSPLNRHPTRSVSHVKARDPISYLRAYEMVRNITGTGEGNGPMIAIHDGFSPTSTWAGFLSGADRLALGELSLRLTGGITNAGAM